jgi:raffinose/stachyose/melibiose transport system permease protein
MKVITLAISAFFAQTEINLNAAATVALMAVLPITIVYLSLQRYFV